MKIVVTGGAGFIGSWLVESLLQKGHSVCVLDNLSPQIHGVLPSVDLPWLGDARVRFERADVRDWTVLERLLGEVEAVVHLAAETGTGQSMYQIAHYYDVNVQATAVLFELIARRCRHVRKVVLASSRSIYGEGAYRLDGLLVVPAARSAVQLGAGQWEPVGPNGESLTLVATPETATPRPASIYAATKLAIEDMSRVFAEAYDVGVIALRFQNVYGERQSLRNPYTGILSIFSNRMRQDLPINIFEDGKESRDFVHVQDVVRSIELALAPAPAGFDALNIGSGKATPVLEIAERLRALLKSKSEIRISGDFRVGDIRHCYADLSRAGEALGFAPAMTLDAGLERFIAWVQTRPVLQDHSAEAQRELSKLGLGKVTV